MVLDKNHRFDWAASVCYKMEFDHRCSDKMMHVKMGKLSLIIIDSNGVFFRAYSTIE